MSATAAPARVDPIRFINNLTHTKGPFARQKFNLRPWQVDIVSRLFQQRADGLRQYRTCLLMLPRKNGKSELAAAVALYGLLGDGEIGAEVYSAASDKDQASLVFNVAAQMVRNDARLEAQVEIVDSQKRIVHRKSGSFYRAISAEAYSKHGFNASLVIYDELHAAPSRELYDVLSTSMGARTQPLFFAISTAGHDRHSILWDLYAHGKRVAENPDLDPTFLPILYEAPEGADWMDPAVWAAANPALGDFRSLEDMQIKAQRAQQMPGEENVFRNLYLNQWTEQASRWIPLAAWDACQAPIDRAALRGRRCYVGMDLASTTDLAALVAVFPDDAGGFDVLPTFFCPAEGMRTRSLRDRVPYDVWARAGHLEVTEGDRIDYRAIRARLNAWATEFQVRMIGFDPWNATDLVTQLKEIDKLPCVEIRQILSKLAAPTKSLNTAIVGRNLRHDGHPVLRWNVSNVAVETTGEDVMISKKHSTEKIDGVAALVMAIDQMDRLASVPEPTYQFFTLSAR